MTDRKIGDVEVTEDLDAEDDLTEARASVGPNEANEVTLHLTMRQPEGGNAPPPAGNPALSEVDTLEVVAGLLDHVHDPYGDAHVTTALSLVKARLRLLSDVPQVRMTAAAVEASKVCPAVRNVAERAAHLGLPPSEFETVVGVKLKRVVSGTGAAQLPPGSVEVRVGSPVPDLPEPSKTPVSLAIRTALDVLAVELAVTWRLGRGRDVTIAVAWPRELLEGMQAEAVFAAKIRFLMTELVLARFNFQARY